MVKTKTPSRKTKTYHSSGNGSSKKIIIVPGFSEGLAENKDLTDKVAKETGADTYTFEQPRRRSEGDPIDPIERLGVIVASNALEVIGGEGKIVAVAHSLGCAAVLRAVQLNPDIFDSVILMQPPGLGPSAKTSLPSLARRVAKKSFKNYRRSVKGQNPHNPKGRKYRSNFDDEAAEKYKGRVLKSQISGIRVIAKNPILALREALAVGEYRIDADIQKATDELGVPVHVVISNEDEILSDKVGNIPYASSVSYVADKKAGHDTFWMQPKRTAMIVDGLLRQKNQVDEPEAFNDPISKQ